MGKGDIKTKRGKISNRSYGVRRPRKKAVKAAPSGKKKRRNKRLVDPKVQDNLSFFIYIQLIGI